MKQAELQLRRCIEENTRSAQDQDEYDRRYDELADKLKLLNNMVAETEEEILELKARKEKICRFLDELQKTDTLVTEFEESLWHATVDSVKVGTDKTLNFLFKDGTKIAITASENN